MSQVISAYIDKITLPSGTTYNLRDSQARSLISQLTSLNGHVLQYVGQSETPLSDGATNSTIVINGDSHTVATGDVAIYQNKQYVAVVTNGTVTWNQFGSTGSLKSLAFKDQANGQITPYGTVSQPTFTGNNIVINSNVTPAGSVSISVNGAATNKYVPSGNLEGGSIAVQTNNINISTLSNNGSVSNGTAASCTLPTFSASVSNHQLTLSFSAGSFTANTPTSVTLPTFAQTSVANGIKTATLTNPTFTGTQTTLTGTFTGTQSAIDTVTVTPTGIVSQPTFTGTTSSVTVS